MAYVKGKKCSLMDRAKENDVIKVAINGVCFAFSILFCNLMSWVEAVFTGKINNSFIFSSPLALTWCLLDILANVQLLDERTLATMIFWTLMTQVDIIFLSALFVCVAVFGWDDVFFENEDYMYIVRSCKVVLIGLIVVQKIMSFVIVYKEYKKGRRDVKITVKV
jgi:hypothetical protein